MRASLERPCAQGSRGGVPQGVALQIRCEETRGAMKRRDRAAIDPGWQAPGCDKWRRATESFVPKTADAPSAAGHRP